MQIPIYAHIKELIDPQTGRRTALEVNYCKFLAYNGSYKLFGWIYIGEVGLFITLNPKGANSGCLKTALVVY